MTRRARPPIALEQPLVEIRCARCRGLVCTIGAIAGRTDLVAVFSSEIGPSQWDVEHGVRPVRTSSASIGRATAVREMQSTLRLRCTTTGRNCGDLVTPDGIAKEIERGRTKTRTLRAEREVVPPAH